MQKRPLVISAILFFIGVMLSFYNLSALITLFFIILLCMSRRIKSKRKKLFWLVFIVIYLGAVRMIFAQVHKDSIISRYAGESKEMSLVITEPTKDGRAAAYLCGEEKVKVYLTVKRRTELFCGDIVTGEITLDVPSENKIGASSFPNHLASRGIYLQASAEGVQITGRYEDGIMGKIYSLRRYMNSLGERLFSGNSRALFNAMIFGDKSLLSDELYSALQGSGLNHIAVVSGMHLSVAIAFIMLLVRRVSGNLRRGFVIAILSAIFITLISGGGASVVRALLMCSLFYLSHILYRENDPLTSLFCAFWIMMLVNPYIVFNVGFVLSALSILGIILFGKKFFLFFRRFLPEKVANAVSLTLSAQLILTPVIIYYFGVITPYAPLSNVVAVPLSALYVIAGMLLVVLSPLKAITQILSPIMNFLAEGIENLCIKISSIPYALIDFEGDFLIFVLVWIFLIFMVYLHPAPTKKIAKTVLVFSVVMVCIVLINGKSFDSITFTPYGKYTLAQGETKGGSFLLDCPDIYDINSSGKLYESVVITGKYVQGALNTKSNINKIYLPDALCDKKTKEKLIDQAKDGGKELIFKADGEWFMAGGTIIRYTALQSVEDVRAPELIISNKRIITLQGLTKRDVETLLEKGEKLHCDYLYVPYDVPEKEKLTTGEIISNNKFLLQR